ncbi:FdhF/YdeP family oxidoreductase [Zobellia galactanivorans]|uniref:Molybdopterin-containing oxidoreductase, alpha subunit n=1 Tax=Zobellia galactanivorans (strain DSM 12802 / CCUG 47099 / CIP 106680 / NCIMB 13871 / Dsij) TaxID=63186 RepID=G0L7Q4_ZOBGA|nr:FdhF/YdeP family oxidoreductase [Zobellia galactanivorans]CAZ98200.1 Molybdopterin-containing oxidoreductase, alpha subunit [Zobellia galactanivorans]
MQNENFRRKVSVIGSEDFSNIKITEPVRYAAGKLGVKEALRHGFKEMGIVRSMRAFLELNQEDGFDCPSCAWPNPEKPSTIAEYCENGAKAVADEATTDKIGREFFKKYSVEELSKLTEYQLNKFGRLTEPLVLRPGSIHYEPISWQESYELISEELGRLKSPDDAIFYTSGRSSNEAAYLYGMFARALGTNNMPDCSNMCHESSGVALSETLGIGKGSVKLEDLYGADVVIVAGQNPGTNHPRMLSALEKCKKNGGKVISINPLEESGLINFKNPQHVKGLIGGGENLTDIHLQVRINQDIALMKLILKRLAALDEAGQKVFNHDFLGEYVDGYQELLDDLARYDESSLLELCGVEEAIIDETVALLATSSNIVICWAMGLTQHKNGVATICEYLNLLLLKGSLGKPNAGTCPVRGHSNVQGDRSVGIMHFVNPELNERIEKHLGFKAPDKEGLDVVGAIKAMHDESGKVFICLGGNFLMAASDTLYTAEAMQNCELTVQISTKLNRSHLVTGKTALILPTFGRSEKDMKGDKLRYQTMEDSMGRVRQSRGLLKPTSENIKSEPELIAELAHTHFGAGHSVNWKAMGEDYELIRESIDLIIKGFENTKERSKGIGYYLPNNVRDLDFSMLPNGRAQLTRNPLPEHDLKDEELMLMTIRSHDQFNTTIYGMDDRYRGIYNERRVLFMNAKDMEKRNLKKMDVVHIKSTYNGKVRTAHKFLVVPYNIPSGDLAAYYPETNVLVPYDQYADKSKTPISKSIKVTVEKAI